jgi:hypothetical protein
MRYPVRTLVGHLMRSLALAVLLIPLWAMHAPLGAQDPPAAGTTRASKPSPPDTVMEVRLRDGSVLYGRVVEETPERIVLVTVTGVRLDLPRAQIESMRVSAGRGVDGTFWAEDPNSTRLFFTSTARPLKKGNGYVSSFMLFLPLVAYGVTDRFTIAGGTPIIPEAFGRMWYFAPKYTVAKSERSAYALGALAFILPEDIDDNGSVGILYGAGTWGSRDHAITAGAGWGYVWVSGASEVANDPVIMIAGETRVSRRVKLITENWMFTSGETDGFVSGGVRFIGDRLSADLGVGGFTGASDGCCFPLVNFVYNFGKR